MSSIRVMPTPRDLSIAITGRCNLRCQYCFYADEMAALSDLPTERWLAFFEELGKLGVMDLSMMGGEAFARPDLFELVNGAVGILDKGSFPHSANITLSSSSSRRNGEPLRVAPPEAVVCQKYESNRLSSWIDAGAR